MRNDFSCRIRRIDDMRWIEFRKNGIPINEQFPVFSSYVPNECMGHEPLNLAEYYALMNIAFGKTGRLYDDWKGAFAYPFEVEVFNAAGEHKYIMKVTNWRDTVELRFNKIINDPSRMDAIVCKHPDLEEFYGEEMSFVDAFLYGCLLSFRSRDDYYQIPEFSRQIDSNIIKFGFQGGKFFETHYSDYEDYQRCARQNHRLEEETISNEIWPVSSLKDWLVITAPSSVLKNPSPV